MGDDASVINDIVSGKHPIAKKLQSAQRPVVIVGVDQLSRPDGGAILAALHSFAAKLSKPVGCMRKMQLKFIAIKLKNFNYFLGLECIQCTSTFGWCSWRS